jgi:hypothetical protein
MNRRYFLQSGGMVSVSLAFAKTARLFSQVTTADRWRTFHVTAQGRSPEALRDDTHMDAGGTH